MRNFEYYTPTQVLFGKDSSTDIYNFLHTENGKTEIYRFWTEYFMGIM